MLLVKRARNVLYEAIQVHDASPGDFAFTQEDKSATLEHLRSKACLYITVSNGFQWHVAWTAGKPGEEIEHESLLDNFPQIVDRIGEWLRAIAADEETPDLWAELGQQQQTFSAGALEAGENTPFTPAEQRLIAVKLEELKANAVDDYALSGEQLRELEARLDYLDKAATRVGRLDWRNLVAGALLSAVTGAALPPDVVQGIFGTLVNSVAHLFGAPIPQLPS
jgi:hypothetical protein